MSTDKTTDEGLTVNIKLRISEQLREELETVAKASDRNMAQEMRRALRHWVNSKEARNAA